MNNNITFATPKVKQINLLRIYSAEQELKRVYIQYIPVDRIRPNPFQVRTAYGEDEMKELKQSILAEDGLIHPITVRPDSMHAGFYEIASGHRRLVACQGLGWKLIPAIVLKLSSEEMIKLGLIENLHRKNQNPIEEAKVFAILRDHFNIEQDRVAFEVRKTREYVAQRLRLLNFPKWIQELVSRETLSVSVAEAIASTRPEIQEKLFSMIQEGWEPTVKRVCEFAQTSLQLGESTRTSKSTGESKGAGQTIAEKVANAVRTGEDNFRVPCSICGKPMYFSNRDGKWEGDVKPILYGAFKNWHHTSCAKN